MEKHGTEPEEKKQPKRKSNSKKSPKIKTKAQKKPRQRIPKDKDGWIDAGLFYTHEPFDLVQLRDKRGNVGKGWWDGITWTLAIPRREWHFGRVRQWRRIPRSESLLPQA